MANICNTYYYIEPQQMSSQELEKDFTYLYEMGRKIWKKNNREYPCDQNAFTETDFFNDILLCDFYLNTEEIDTGSDPFGNDCLIVRTFTKWGPKPKMFEMIMDIYDPTAKILYEAEEPGTELYWTNLPEFDGCVNLDYCDEELMKGSGFEPHETYPWDDVRPYLLERFPDIYTPQMTIDELNDALCDADIDLVICEWAMVDIGQIDDDFADDEYKTCKERGKL